MRALIAGLICAGSGGVPAFAASRPTEGNSPYAVIVTQNVFRLRPEVRAEVQVHRSLPVVPLSIRVTGFTDVCGRSQVLLEISEPGKTVVRPVLAEGDQFMGIEAEAVNVGTMHARLRINGESRDVTLSGGQSTPPDFPGLKVPRK